MASLDRPKLRPLVHRRVQHDGQTFACIDDPLNLFDRPVLLPIASFGLITRHFDGATSLADIQARIHKETGRWFPRAELEALVERLDRAMVLDGPTFQSFHASYRRQPVRAAALAGRSYSATEGRLRAELAGWFQHADGAGEPSAHHPKDAARVRGILSPHIDFHRGGPVYTWPYRALVERSDAEIFVIVGVAHQLCRNRFALTRKDFGTPLGLVATDRGFVEHIAERAGAHLFDDELAHRTEHSIEFQVVFLQYLLQGRRPFSIVPILVGSFQDLMDRGRDPIESRDVRLFIDAVRSAEAASGKKVAYIGGIDLCHVGPEFGDPEPVSDRTLGEVRVFDGKMLEHAAARNPAGWFGTAADVGNRWRVCGLAATYTMLHAMGPARGRILKYHQAVDDRRTTCVTFAGVAFDGPDDTEVLPRA
jgi:AmmeMemoRadiSam system protein B